MKTSLSILIVDDEPTIREVLAAMLADDGFRIACASDGQQALDQIAVEPPDLIISDVSMPKIDGVTMVNRLRARGDGIPVILMSAHSAAVDLPGARFTAKPFDLDAIIEAVTQSLFGRVP